MKESIDKKIQEIVDIFGMKAEVCGRAMNVSSGTYRKKKSTKVIEHSFNEKNLQDLILYIKEHASKL